MSVLTKGLEEEPPTSPGAAVVGKISRLLLLAVCAAPIAVFPIGPAYKGYMHFFGAANALHRSPRVAGLMGFSILCRAYGAAHASLSNSYGPCR